MNASAGSSVEVENVEVEKESWLVTESLPFGSDVDQTLPMEVGDDLPVGVGVMLQKEDKLQKEAEHVDSEPHDPGSPLGGNAKKFPVPSHLEGKGDVKARLI